MAATGAFSMSLLLKDEFGTKATAPIYITADTTNTLNDLATYAVTYAQDADLVTGAQIEGVEVRFRVNPTGLKSAPIAGSRVEQTMLTNLKVVGSSRKDGVDLPAVRDTVLVSGTDRIDETNADVIAYAAFLHTASGLITPVTPWGNVLSLVADFLLSFREHRKQLSRSSAEPGGGL